MARISLRKIKLTDKKYFSKWWRDKELLKLTSGILNIISDEEVKKYFLAMAKNKIDYHFMIVANKKVVGHISLVKRKNNWYETQIIIGDKKYWSRGYGTKAIKLLTNKAKKLGISKIYLEVRPDNIRAIKAYEKSGFRKYKTRKYPANKYLPETLVMRLSKDQKRPKLKFSTGRKRELEVYSAFLSQLKYRDISRDMNWAFYDSHPDLRILKQNNSNYSENKLFVKKYVDKYYKNNFKSILKGVLEAKNQWHDIEEEFFKLIGDIFNNYKWPKGKYIAYPTIWGMYPRFLEEKVFQFPFAHKKKRYVPVVIAHEMLHFIFYDYFYKHFPKYKYDKYNIFVWHISEIFNTVIQNSPEWLKVFKMKSLGYPEHDKIVFKLSKKYYKKSDWRIDNLIKNIIDMVVKEKLV